MLILADPLQLYRLHRESRYSIKVVQCKKFRERSFYK